MVYVLYLKGIEIMDKNLDKRIINEIHKWKRGKRLKFDVVLMKSNISFLRNIISKTKGTTKIKNLSVNGKRQKYVMIDNRLVQHLISVFESDCEFQNRFKKHIKKGKELL